MPPAALEQRPELLEGVAARKQWLERLRSMSLFLNASIGKSFLLKILWTTVVPVERRSIAIKVVEEQVIVVDDES
jgi:hypothetical protein